MRDFVVERSLTVEHLSLHVKEFDVTNSKAVRRVGRDGILRTQLHAVELNGVKAKALQAALSTDDDPLVRILGIQEVDIQLSVHHTQVNSVFLGVIALGKMKPLSECLLAVVSPSGVTKVAGRIVHNQRRIEIELAVSLAGWPDTFVLRAAVIPKLGVQASIRIARIAKRIRRVGSTLGTSGHIESAVGPKEALQAVIPQLVPGRRTVDVYLLAQVLLDAGKQAAAHFSSNIHQRVGSPVLQKLLAQDHIRRLIPAVLKLGFLPQVLA